MTVGLVLLFASLAVRGASANRHLRARLLASAFAFAAYAILQAALGSLALSANLQQQLHSALPLLLAFGGINAIVAVAMNPWRSDRASERIPTILQDTIVIVLFAVVATVVLQERVFAMTAAGAVVVGFALQDTLGNLFAGLAIQVEKPFCVGQWVRIGDTDGLVSEITWRATKIRTKAGNFVVVPNSKISDETIVNYSEPTPETRIEVDLGASYDVAPNDAKAAIHEALQADPLIPTLHEPDVLLIDFGPSALIYRIRVWTTDFSADERIRDRIRSAVYYAFRRHSIEIPYPTQVEIARTDAAAQTLTSSPVTLLERIPMFAPLSDAARSELAAATTRRVYGAGEVIVRQEDSGSSMFVIERGAAVVSLEPSQREVARLGPGDFFGEMSLLTGTPRSATVRALSDAQVFEITVDDFRRVVLANPAVVEQVGLAVARRAAELEEHRAAGAATDQEPPQTFVERVRRFLRLSAT